MFLIIDYSSVLVLNTLINVFSVVFVLFYI
jgi:hypothetical protein